MPLELKSTVKEFVLEDESGYSFRITAVYDPEWGWNASLSVTAHGFVEAEDAINALELPLTHALRLLKEAKQ
jgi:hypothetical protein